MPKVPIRKRQHHKKRKKYPDKQDKVGDKLPISCIEKQTKIMAEDGEIEGMNIPENLGNEEGFLNVFEYPVYIGDMEIKEDPTLTQEVPGSGGAVLLTTDFEYENQQNTLKAPDDDSVTLMVQLSDTHADLKDIKPDLVPLIVECVQSTELSNDVPGFENTDLTTIVKGEPDRPGSPGYDVTCIQVPSVCTDRITIKSEPQDGEIVSPRVVGSDLSSGLLALLKGCMPKEWDVRVTSEYAHAVMWVPGIPAAVQRAIYAPFNGTQLKFIAHVKILPSNHEVYVNNLLKPPVPLSDETLNDFADVVMSAVHTTREFRTCVGIDVPNFVDKWFNHKNCRLDENYQMEKDYERTLRVFDCHYLVRIRKRRCSPCGRFLETLKKREQRLLEKLKPQPARLRDTAMSKKTETESQYQLERVAEVLEANSIEIGKDLQADLECAFENTNGLIKVLWEEQRKINMVKNTTKCHPVMLRWALLKRAAYSPGYQAMYKSGFVKLQSGRTLYEYNHASSKDGVQEQVIKRASESVFRFVDDFLKYHVVVVDEVYVANNVVYHKDSGEVAGYVTLDDVKNEIAQLEKELVSGVKKSDNPVQCVTMLTYLVKGVANGVRGIAAWCEAGLNGQQFNTKTWDIVRKLEESGIKVIAISGNSNIVNQFFSRHRPMTLTDSAVIFDTLNIFSSDCRPIFFFNSAYDLLRLIRNCFANSGAHKKTRLLLKKGEVISWQTIVNIYRSKESSCCKKLTALHVFLNSSSIMKVHVAAQVMSRTVASYIERCKLPNTTETVKFIRYVNDFYDCLSGANLGQTLKAKNLSLAPYKNVNDYRFSFLMEFLCYLKEWQKEVAGLPIPESEKKKTLLSSQILIGLERTIRAFISAVRYVLEKRSNHEGALMASVFQENPLEHYTPESASVSFPTESRILGNQNISDINKSIGTKRLKSDYYFGYK